MEPYTKCLNYKREAQQTNKQTNKEKQTTWSESESELYWLSDRRLSAKLVPTLENQSSFNKKL
jgi:hypothetical protein